jgi:hypothetical protein
MNSVYPKTQQQKMPYLSIFYIDSHCFNQNATQKQHDILFAFSSK